MTETAVAGNSSVRRTLFSERNLFPRFLALTAVGLLIAVLPAAAKPKQPAAVQTAGIENTGSTNTLGYTIAISSNYGARVSGGSSVPILSHLPRTITDKFFADLNAAMPLTALPVRHGMRSASFGTRTTITYKGQRSPDLTFAADPRTAALKADIDNITKMLHVGNAPKRPIVIHSDR